MDIHIWFAYFCAALGLALTPGPNSMLVLTNGVIYGAKRTNFTIIGGLIGFFILMVLAVSGASAVLKAFPVLLNGIKVVGGCYLIWLGAQLWRSPVINFVHDSVYIDKNNITLFRQGFFSAIANPKVILFLGAFLTSFIDLNRQLLPQFVIMIATYLLCEGTVEFVVSRLAHSVRPSLAKYGKKFNFCCGLVFIIIASLLIVTIWA